METISSASAEAVPQPPRKFQPGIPKLPPEVIRPQQPRLTHSTRNTEHERPATPVALRMVDLALDNLAKQDWFHPLPLQRYCLVKSLHVVFKGHQGRTGRMVKSSALPRTNQHLRVNRFRRQVLCQKEKKTLPGVPAAVQRFERVTAQHHTMPPEY
jgi:hypothetical protein